MGMFGALSVFGRHIKGMIQLRPEQVWTCNVTRHHHPLLSPSGSCNKLGTPRCNAHRILLCCEAQDESSDHHSVSCQLLATYGAAVCGNSASVYPPLLLLETWCSAAFPQDVLPHPPAHHHHPPHAQSQVTPYTCTLFLSSLGSSTTLVPLWLMRTAGTWQWLYSKSQTVRCLWPAADNLHREYIGVKCSFVLCMRANTIIFCRVVCFILLL
jgi:hypothetical protein